MDAAEDPARGGGPGRGLLLVGVRGYFTLIAVQALATAVYSGLFAP